MRLRKRFKEKPVFGVMEDDPLHYERIARSFQRAGCRVRRAKSKADVHRLAEQGVRNYALDIDMGRDKEREGIDVFKELRKKILPDLYAGFLTVHTGYERQARKLKANFFVEKQADTDQAVESIVAGLVDREESEYFDERVKNWKTETETVSSIERVCGHPSYLDIVAMSWSAVPLILQEFERELDHWGPALIAITRENPVRPESSGRLDHILRDWKNWAKKQNL